MKKCPFIIKNIALKRTLLLIFRGLAFFPLSAILSNHGVYESIKYTRNNEYKSRNKSRVLLVLGSLHSTIQALKMNKVIGTTFKVANDVIENEINKKQPIPEIQKKDNHCAIIVSIETQRAPACAKNCQPVKYLIIRYLEQCSKNC